MSEAKTPRDAIGNEIIVGKYVDYHVPGPLFFKVVAVENGGIHTANGITPAKVRLVCDITLALPPGVPFVNLVTPVDPTQQALVDAAASSRLPL
jgi:hypothetical protein